MGLFDSVLKNVIGGAVGGGVKNILLQEAISMIANQQAGGLAGLLKQFTGQGLGDAVASWVGTGKNMPISADQLMSVLGQKKINQLAQKAGASPDDVAGGLANLLPEIVDSLTPDGKIPDNNGLEQGLGALKKLMGGL